MCLAKSNVRFAGRWNWDGDTIVHNTIIPNSRKIPDERTKYDIDIRSYISSSDNAVIRSTLRQIIKKLPQRDQSFITSREAGSFDFRMRKIMQFISTEIKYIRKSRESDNWLFPEETLALKEGDCEDRAFLLASLLIASGISSYVIRVALGKVYDTKTRKSRDHIWVMYKNEAGYWMLIEPLVYLDDARKHTQKIMMYGKKDKERVYENGYEYIPYFVFNNNHLWRLTNNVMEIEFREYIGSRRFWRKFDPKFAAGVHFNIIDEALAGLDWWDRQYIKDISLSMDINPVMYDPRDHFDNGYIEESWDIIRNRLDEKTLDGLAYACHAVADFYAHTTYAHFAKRDSGGLMLYDHNKSSGQYNRNPEYNRDDFDLKSDKFSVNEAMCKCRRVEIIRKCNNMKIISGRFAQPGDQKQGFLEKVFVYIPYELRKKKDFKNKTCLPHHNEIAVDDKKKPEGHTLYDDNEYSMQYRLRRDAAIRHIKLLYKEWKSNR